MKLLHHACTSVMGSISLPCNWPYILARALTSRGWPWPRVYWFSSGCWAASVRASIRKDGGLKLGNPCRWDLRQGKCCMRSSTHLLCTHTPHLYCIGPYLPKVHLCCSSNGCELNPGQGPWTVMLVDRTSVKQQSSSVYTWWFTDRYKFGMYTLVILVTCIHKHSEAYECLQMIVNTVANICTHACTHTHTNIHTNAHTCNNWAHMTSSNNVTTTSPQLTTNFCRSHLSLQWARKGRV